MADEMKWIRSNISIVKHNKASEYLVTLNNSGNLIADYKKYADYFFNGAEEVIHYLSEEAADRQDIAKLDLWYFSMLYLYRQSLELLLKAVIFKHITTNEDRISSIGIIRHDLKQGLDMLLSVTSDYNTDDYDDDIKWLILFFEDISRVDRESDMFRYPFGNSMQVLFEKQTHISLAATHDNMNKAYSILSDMLANEFLSERDYEDYEPKLFVEGGNYYQQSVVGYQYHSGNFYPYFTSYEEVGKFFESLIKTEKRSEMFLPMCYVFRNAVELGLKMLIVEESHMSHDKALHIIKRKKHSLLGLWNSIEAEIEKYANAPEGDTTLSDTKKYIELFHDFDNSSDIFRYPTNKKLDTYHLQPQTLDMLNVASCFHELCNFLSAVDSMLNQVKEYEAEMRSYYADEMSYYEY